MEQTSPRRSRIIRLAFLVAVLAANIAAVQWAIRVPYLGVAPSMRLAAATTLWSAVYVAVYTAWRGRCTLPSGIKEVPAMNLRTVIVYIYGLGLGVFATILATLGVSGCATLNYVCGMTAVCIGDTLERAYEPWFRRMAVAVAGISGAAAVHLIANDEPHFQEYALAIERRDAVAIAYGLVVPLVAPFAFYLTRRHSYSSPALIRELIGFAFPFAGLLSALILCTLPPEPGASENLLWGGALLPLFCLPVLFFGVQTALLFSTVDFLCALALVLGTKHFVVATDSPDALLALCFAGIAFLLRLCTCLHRDDVDGRDMCGSDPERAELKETIQPARSACGSEKAYPEDADA
jgi:hypothetical protein